ncbi:disulfide bond formation protein DsbD [Tistrella bauzanensis]|uniref:Disulfide bond formation protein DsbD n=1 Tax=Tistrella bauzanensis TaxID=657419 RepID=A0ABQ1IBH8_9PROT|nr:DsbA family protein [Tistrella bauzanensis]GGB29836.1 disulfide bond formation protein DsbD [Tistrella bauzanensis]
MRNLTYGLIGIAAVAVVGLGAWQFALKDEPAATPAQPAAGSSQPAANQSTAGASALAQAQPGDHVIGDPAAPVTIVEYSSLTCPHCAAFHATTLQDIKARYIDQGQVKVVLRHFPLNEPALVAAKLAECVAPERYAGFVDVLFRSQAEWGTMQDPTEGLKRYGRLAGLSDDRMQSCLTDGAIEEKILSQRLEGSRVFQIDSTPTFIVNGEKVTGNLPIDEFAKVIDAKLP